MSTFFKPRSANVVINAIDYFYDLYLIDLYQEENYNAPGIMQVINIFSQNMKSVSFLYWRCSFEMHHFHGCDCGIRASETANLGVSDIGSKRNKSRYAE